MQYRVHIDIPLGNDEDDAIRSTLMIVGALENNFPMMKSIGIEQVNFRLGHDEDRQKSNYMSKNENGHVGNKKTRIDLI